MRGKIRLTEDGLRRVICYNVKRIINEWNGDDRRESTNVEDRRGQPMYKYAPDLIRSELQSLAICYEIQPKLIELKKNGLLEDFLSSKFRNTKYKVDNTVIDLLTSVWVPSSGDHKKDYYDYLENYDRKYPNNKLRYGPFICVYKDLGMTQIMRVRPWFRYLSKVLEKVNNTTIKNLRQKKRYEERGNAAAQGVRTNFSPHLTR